MAKAFKTGHRDLGASFLLKLVGAVHLHSLGALKSQPIIFLISLFHHQACRMGNTFCD